MPAISYYGDEHVSRAVADGLTARGIDIVLAVDVGMTGAADVDHLTRAHEMGRVVVTRDRDFLRIHRKNSEHSGIIYLTGRWTVGDLIRELASIQSMFTADDIAGEIEYL